MGVCRKLETSDITKRSVTNLGDRLDVVHVMDLVYGQNFTAKSKLKSFSFRLDVFVLMVTPDSNTAKSVSVSNSTARPVIEIRVPWTRTMWDAKLNFYLGNK